MTEDESLSDSTTTIDTPPSEKVGDIKLISRIGSIPLIYDITNKTTLGKFAVSTATSTLSTVNKYQPKYIQTYYEQYIQPHVEKVDEYGCRSLDLIQEKYPVVNQPTSDIIHSITPTYQLVTPVVDSFEAVIDKYLPGESKIDEKNQAKRAYYLINSATSRLSQRSRQDLTASIQKIQAQLTNFTQHLFVVQQEKIAEISTQLNHLLQDSPEWLKSIVQVAQKQIDIVRHQYERNDIKTLEKAKQVVLAIHEQLVPVVQHLKE